MMGNIFTHPGSITWVTASSGNVANADAIATIPAVAGKTAHLSGFAITSTGSTLSAVVSPTIGGVISGTMTFTYVTVTGSSVINQPLNISFSPAIPASAHNTAIVVTLPALGSGNTNATCNAWGYYT